jgi:hypothetical protein
MSDLWIINNLMFKLKGLYAEQAEKNAEGIANLSGMQAT